MGLYTQRHQLYGQRRFIPTPVGRTGPGCPGCFPDRHVPYSYFTPIHAPWPECLYPNASLSHSACFDEIIHLFSSPCLSLAVAPSIYICLYNVYILFSCCQCFIFPLPKQDKSLLKTVFRFSFREFSRKLHSIIRLVFFCPRCVEHVLHSRTFLLYIHFIFE